MPHKKEQKPQPINVVQIDSSSDEDDDGVAVVISTTTNKSSSFSLKPKPKPHPQQNQSSEETVVTPPAPAPVPQSESLLCRSFWKAQAYDVVLTARTSLPTGELEHARVHPKFLHSNATSHKWAFGAIAELLDNAVDEIQNGATFVMVDKIDILKDNSPALLFQDDGGGMDPESIRKCMSLGYSSKKSNKTIGQYGNGFKTSTMRLGADVIVFSRASHASKATQSVGLLSYTFLRKTGQDDVIVPMVDFDISGHWAEPIIYSSQDDWSANLKTILEWSPFSSKDELLQQFEDIGRHGTKIIIYNLWLNDEGIYELSFDDDDEDIRLRDEASCAGQKLNKKVVELQSHISYRIRYSLRAYASILYLRKFTNFSIILRGKPVEQFNIADDLKYSKLVTYKPQLGMASKEVAAVETSIGFIKEAPALCISGFNVYHKNRLIRPFWKVTSDGSSKGNGVVGVLEANFIEPAHDKQDFERSSVFIRLEAKLKQILTDYWNNHCHLVGYQYGLAQKKHSAKSRMPLSINQLDEEEMHLDQPRNDGQINFPLEHPITGSADGSLDEDIAGFISIDQICEENIQLFMRCEEHRQKEAELKRLVTDLEKELEQEKRKLAQLSVHLETKKKQKALEQQTHKVS
ncbi:protein MICRORCHIDIA 2 isoform X2 [Jatropha curcas]|uniref:protein MICRORCHIDIA 2 isoform X2 n=1 Tax=Jatropha curcas TaxID=180498 RepID=UPI0005FB1982|nr:protein MICRORCHIDIA 2 isoform X2 [Jatropha curcas]